MKRILFSIFFLFTQFVFLSAYSQDTKNLKTVKYVGSFPSGSKTFKKKYYMDIPDNYSLDNRQTLTGDYKTEYRFLYPDSSIIYIVNDEWRGSSLNFQNLFNAGINGYVKENLLDTLNNYGIQKNGKYWREYVLGEIVVGYVDCPKEKVKYYDMSLSTIRKKKKKH